MKMWTKFSIVLGIAGWAFLNVWAGPAPPSGVTASILAIRQASDPSAVVAAYANGVAINREDPKLYEAYISRMVDLGLPELAYHQAQSLTLLQSDNGLAWGVLAYVDARRGEMPEAVSAISLAGQFAPDSPFVQRTAGEIIAWYDVKADKAKLPDNAKEGLAKARSVLEKSPAFNEAYTAAKNAYQAQATLAPAVAPSQGTTASNEVVPPPPPVYSPDYYYYDWGPSWVEPVPWWWWQPVGFFVGFNFFPASTFVVFNDHFFFDHHVFIHDRDDFRFHNRFHHDGVKVTFHDSNHAFFVHDGKTTFFGTTARPNPSVGMGARTSFANRTFARSAGMHGTTGRAIVDPAGMQSHAVSPPAQMHSMVAPPQPTAPHIS